MTSRSPYCRASTERELKKNCIDLTLSELKTIDENKLSISIEVENKELSYLNGIFMTSGLNKGEMLAYIIRMTGKNYKALVFVDDTEENINDVNNKFSTCSNIDIVLFYFTKVLSERLLMNNNQVLTKEQADSMFSDWEYLIKTLNDIFPERLHKSLCGKKIN